MAIHRRAVTRFPSAQASHTSFSSQARDCGNATMRQCAPRNGIVTTPHQHTAHLTPHQHSFSRTRTARHEHVVWWTRQARTDMDAWAPTRSNLWRPEHGARPRGDGTDSFLHRFSGVRSICQGADAAELTSPGGTGGGTRYHSTTVPAPRRAALRATPSANPRGCVRAVPIPTYPHCITPHTQN